MHGNKLHVVRLLARPLPIKGESWPGYLLRLTSKNCLPGIGKLAVALNLDRIQFISIPPKELLPRLGITWTPAAHPKFDRSLHTRFDNPPLLRLGRNSRVCTLCLKTDRLPYIRAVWDNPSVVRCDTHDVLLLDRCERCSLEINHYRSAVDACLCGQKFTVSPSAPPPIWLGNLERILFVPSARVASCGTFASYTDRCQKAAIAIHMLLQRDEYQCSSPYAWPRNTRNAFLGRNDIERLCVWMKDWPVGFQRQYLWIRRNGMSNLGPSIDPKRLNLGLFPALALPIKLVNLPINVPSSQRRLNTSLAYESSNDHVQT